MDDVNEAVNRRIGKLLELLQAGLDLSDGQIDRAIDNMRKIEEEDRIYGGEFLPQLPKQS